MRSPETILDFGELSDLLVQFASRQASNRWSLQQLGFCQRDRARPASRVTMSDRSANRRRVGGWSSWTGRRAGRSRVQTTPEVTGAL